MAGDYANGHAARIISTRIVEALVIAGITAGVSVYASTQVLEAKLEGLERLMEVRIEAMDQRIRAVERIVDGRTRAN